MKQFKIILCFLLLSTALSISASAKDHNATVDTSRATTPDNKIIPAQRIGAIRLGMGMDEVQGILGKPPESSNPPTGAFWVYPDLNLEISFTQNAAPIVVAVGTTSYSRKAEKNLLWKEIRPVKVAFQTANGITLGSTSFDVQRAYGNQYEDPNVRLSYGTFMNYKSLGLTFMITSDHIVWKITVLNAQ